MDDSIDGKTLAKPHTKTTRAEPAEDMLSWVISGKLARGSRPGYAGEHGQLVSQATVDAWIEETRAFGIRSIICLLGDDQLHLYQQLPVDLISYYIGAGFEVGHISTRDHQQPPLSPNDLEKIWMAYRRLAKPVLVHCSAGIDRTGSAVEYIRQQ